MNPKYKYIDIVFENCNVFRIYPEDIVYICLEDISYSLTINQVHQYWKTKSAKSVRLQLKKSVFSSETEFEKEYKDYSESLRYHLDIYHDITHIVIVDLCGEKENICVPWCTTDEYKNAFEKVEYEEDWITITIN